MRLLRPVAVDRHSDPCAGNLLLLLAALAATVAPSASAAGKSSRRSSFPFFSLPPFLTFAWTCCFHHQALQYDNKGLIASLRTVSPFLRTVDKLSEIVAALHRDDVVKGSSDKAIVNAFRRILDVPGSAHVAHALGEQRISTVAERVRANLVIRDVGLETVHAYLALKGVQIDAVVLTEVHAHPFAGLTTLHTLVQISTTVDLSSAAGIIEATSVLRQIPVSEIAAVLAKNLAFLAKDVDAAVLTALRAIETPKTLTPIRSDTFAWALLDRAVSILRADPATEFVALHFVVDAALQAFPSQVAYRDVLLSFAKQSVGNSFSDVLQFAAKEVAHAIRSNLPVGAFSPSALNFVLYDNAYNLRRHDLHELVDALIAVSGEVKPAPPAWRAVHPLRLCGGLHGRPVPQAY
jgi:hypothetical protein